MAQGLPAAFRIGASLPSGVPAYRQDTIHNSTTQNEFHPDQTVKIPLNTGTTGAFWDTRTSRLLVNCAITNLNPYADFDSFTRCGMAKLIREIAFTVNGVDVEVNRNYASVVELEMIRYARNTDPYYMTFVNEWDVGEGVAGLLHINLVKPCMINSSGSPWLLTLGGNADNAGKDPYRIKHRTQFVGPLNKPMFAHSTNVDYTVHPHNIVGGANSYGIGGLAASSTTLETMPAPGTFGASPGYTPVYVDTDGSGGLGPLTSAHGGAPICWPYYQPYDIEKLAEKVRANRSGRTPLPDVARYFANVKYMPIMPAPAYNGLDHYVGGMAAMPSTAGGALATGTHTIQLRACLELYLGSIGVLAKSAFPALAIGAGRAELSLRLETARRFFQLTMDPCRRVPGTVRDWAPYFGSIGTTRSLDSTATVGDLGRYSGGELLIHQQERKPHTATDMSLTETSFNYLTCLKDAVCIGRYPLSPEETVAGLLMTNTGGTIGVTAHSCFDQTASIRTSAGIRGDMLSARKDNMRELTCRNPFAPPRPQYLPVAEPFVARAAANTVASHVLVTEKSTCFGTYLRYSHPQSYRTIASLRQSVSSEGYINEIPAFTCNGFAFVVDEILFNDAITSSILSAGMAGNAVVETTVLVETVVQLPKNATQNILIPLTGASLSDICIAFQDANELQGVNAGIYSTQNFINPFARLEKTSLNYGGEAHPQYELKTAFSNASDMGINLQFQLGSEMMPRRPLNDIMQFSEFISKGDQVFRGASDHGNYTHMSGHACQLDFHADPGNLIGANKATTLGELRSGFFAPHCPAECLGDQTVTANPFLYSTSRIQGAVADVFPAASLLPLENLFEPLQGTFHIPLNMETFMGQSAKMRSGASIVNNQFYVKFDKAYQCEVSALQMLAYARAHATMVFERGGGVQLIR